MIDTIEQLMDELILQARYPNTKGAYVSTALRKKWMLSHSSVVIKGRRRTAKFTNKGGGVWHVCLDAVEDRG